MKASCATPPTSDQQRLCVGFFSILALHYLLQAAARIATGNALQLDEAEQQILTQEWHWGYGSQGPLYTWLLKLVPLPNDWHVARLALLKNLLLFATHGFVFLLAQRLMASPRAAVAAALGLFLIPGFVHESQRDQSHLVLATLSGAAFAWALVRVVQEQRPRDHALLGLVAAAAVLSKYNTLFLLAGTFFAVLASPAARQSFRTPWGLLGPAVCLTLLLPHAFWAWAHPALLASQSHKLVLQPDAGPWISRFAAAGRWTACVASYATVPLVFLLALGRPTRPRPPSPPEPARQLMGGLVAATLLLAALATIAAGSSSMKVRWLQPVMILLPVLAAGLWQDSLRPPGLRRLAAASGLATVAGFIAVHGSVWGAGLLDRPHHLNVRYDQLAWQIREEGFEGGFIISDDRRIAGNLASHFKGSVAVVPSLDFFQRPAGTGALVVWDAAKGESIPPALRRFATGWVRDWPCHQPSGVSEAPGRRGDPRTTRLVFLIVPSEQTTGS